ncbi:MAG TPA: HAD-IIA family hydrolase [Anaerolineales bacterium]|nr:HAD-IIA family hydrolase [Anaerolineales bacterium]HRF46603.1 HAD-IIA family hydrolase [Anaerolineales bacterium]
MDPITLPASTDVQALIVDMDGVLWEGNRALPGLDGFFAAIRRRALKVVLATNNASQTPEQYVAKLAGFGVVATPAEVMTSAVATAEVLAARDLPNRKAFVIGGDGIRTAMTEAGFELLDLYETGAAVVVVGMDRGLSWDKLATATLNLRAGSAFIGTNPDLTVPTEHGTTHGNGAILAALTAATGLMPEIIGKPEPTMYQLILRRLALAPASALAVGDRLDTDILGAIRAGMPSVCVLSGIATLADITACEARPSAVMAGLPELTDWLNAA